MHTTLGVSAGSEVVCSALVTSGPDGVKSTDYRTFTADDQANADLGELVASSIELMTTQLPPRAVQPEGIAVAYRSKEQTQAIRSAVGGQRRDLQLVPEATAALAYLRSTGVVARYETIALLDLGASGLTVTVLDQTDATVHATARTTNISGAAIDRLVLHYLLAQHDQFEREGRASREMLAARARAAKEHLSTAEAVTIDHVAGRPVKLTRGEFNSLIGGLVRQAVAFAGNVFETAAHQPQALVVIGGGGNIPLFTKGPLNTLGLPVLGVGEPEAVIAKGAAVVADTSSPLHFPVVSLAADPPVGTFTKVAGALAGSLVVVGLIVGYGVQALQPTEDRGVEPAATSNEQTPLPPALPAATTVEVPPTTTPAPLPPPVTTVPEPTTTLPQRPPTTVARPTAPPVTTTPPSTATSTPALRPAPDLPVIPWPDIRQWLPTTTPPPSTDKSGSAVPPSTGPRMTESSRSPDSSTTPTPSTDASTAPAAPRMSESSTTPAQPQRPGTGSSDG